jgi:hypothetical protein
LDDIRSGSKGKFFILLRQPIVIASDDQRLVSLPLCDSDAAPGSGLSIMIALNSAICDASGAVNPVLQGLAVQGLRANPRLLPFPLPKC